jgi:hypothetical protein
VIALRDGAVLADGERIATYAARGPLETAWRSLVTWLGELSPDEAVAVTRVWQVEGTSPEDAAALAAVRTRLAALSAVEAVAPPAGPPDEIADAVAAVVAARTDARHARDIARAVREQVRHAVPARIEIVEPTAPSPRAAFLAPVGSALGGLLGLGGAFAALCAIAFGTSFFAGRQIDVMADTVSTSFARSFFVGLFAQPLVLPALGAVIVGLALTVVGILVIPVAIVAFAATLAAAVVGGYLAVARVAGSAWVHRLRGDHARDPMGLVRSIAWGLAIVLAVWLPAVLLGWLPVAGQALTWLAALVTWGLATTGFGAAVLTRGGVRTTFGHRFQPPELPPATLFERPGPEITTGEWMRSVRTK